MSETVTIARRFCGPEHSGNGGWTAGSVARLVDAPAAIVRLQSPPPLDTPMDVERDDDAVRLVGDDGVIVQGRPAEIEMFAPPLITWGEAVDAARGFEGHQNHPFPRCFTCGTDRTPDDGLCLHTGPVTDKVVAAPWVPSPSVAADDDPDVVDPRAVWAAVDCPGAWAHDFTESPGLLGTMTAVVHNDVHVGQRYVVSGHNDGVDGRKMFASAAVQEAETGTVVARSHTVWIALTPEAVGEFV